MSSLISEKYKLPNVATIEVAQAINKMFSFVFSLIMDPRFHTNQIIV